MKKIFTFWLILGAITAVLISVYNWDTYEWGVRTVLAVMAGGLLFSFPVVLLVGVVMALMGLKKKKS